MQKNPQVSTIGELVSFTYTSQDFAQVNEAYVWDLDKTYLDTRIDSLSGLLDAIVERSFSKKNIPASNIVLRQLQHQWSLQKGNMRFPIFFITASPQQMEERIREKLEFDNVTPMGCYFKNNLRNLQPSRWWRLKKHIGYKISALLHLRLRLPENVEQVLWGDDSESDAIIYNLYSDICSGRVGNDDLRGLLRQIGMANDNVDLICQMREQIPQFDPVKKIYINLAIDTDHDYYLKFGRRTVATYNTFQVALDLFQDKRLELSDVELVFDEMINRYSFSQEELLQSFIEFVKRPQLSDVTVDQVLKLLVQKRVIKENFELKVKPQSVTQYCDKGLRVIELSGSNEPWVQPKIDYLNEYR